MATLRLNVRIPGSSSPIGLVAELRAIADDGRSKLDRTLEVLVNGEHSITGLSAGTWEVRVLAPTGPAVAGEVELPAGGDERLVLDIAGPKAAVAVRSRSAGSNGRHRERPAPDAFFTKEVPWGGGYRGGVFASAGAPRDLRAVTLQLRHDQPSDDWDVIQRWRALARCLDGLVAPRIALSARETSVAGRGGPGTGLDINFDGLPEHRRRVFTTVEHAGRVRLHVVPTPYPWDVLGDGIRLRADVEPGRGLRSSIVLADPRYAGIVAYLASGSVIAASHLVGDGLDALAWNALRGKAASPLGASAAAYVLVGSRDLGSDEPWHGWVSNLREWFPDVPDGAVLDARLRLLKARTEAQMDEVAPLLREAVVRGLPFFAVGVGWLMQSLRHFPHDPFLSGVLPWIERIAAALDMDEPFTTLWIGDER